MEEQTLDDGKLWELVEEAVIKAAEEFVETRITEGENLKKDLISKLNGMSILVDFIEERYPQIVNEYRSKLLAKVTELLQDTRMKAYY